MKQMCVEINDKYETDKKKEGIIGGGILMTPMALGTDEYWIYRVVLSPDQAVIGFPKFSTIGIGFQKEEDWNTNLPYSCDASEIFEHIRHNKYDKNISDEECIKAIQMIKDAIEYIEKS